MFRIRPARLLALLGLVALAGLVVARSRRSGDVRAAARPAAAPDGVASEPVTDDGDAAMETAPDDTAHVPAPVSAEPDSTDAATDEPVTVTARVYAAPEPDVVDEPAATDEPADHTPEPDAVDEPTATDEPADHTPEPDTVDEPTVADEPADHTPEPDAVDEPTATDEPAEPSIDLSRIERDLEGVEAALRRLDEGTYWTDEITGEPLDEVLLAADPVARRNVA